MRTVGFWIVWTLIWVVVAAMVWRRMRHHVKVYLLILISCVHLVGILVIYALSNSVAVW